MKNLLFKLVIVLLMLIIVSGAVLAQDEIMPISEIKAGMTGVGKTVISGTTIEEFDVEILGVLTKRSQVGDLILVKVSGPLIEKTGGIAAGMSGSPVYINGKLIGAIGYGWGMTDHRLGMVTPIETMLQVLEMDHVAKQPGELLRLNSRPEEATQPSASQVTEDVESPQGPEPIEPESAPEPAQSEGSDQATLPIELVDGTVEKIVFCDTYAAALQMQSNSDQLIAYPVQTPIMVNGLSGRALDRLMTDLQQFNLMPVETGGSVTSGQRPTTIEPGGAIAVQLVRGDIDVSAIGTLTYRKGNEVLGFGHPFLGVGPVEYYLSGAEILTVIDHLEIPFKLGVPTEPMGLITQDRNAAVGGQVGLSPKIIPVNITVHDLDLDIEQDIQFQVVRNEELMVSLVINSILQSMDTAMDRQGYGTSTVEFQIMGDKLPDHIIKYSNMYYSSSDIAARSLYDLYNVMNMIVTNPFEKVNLVSIHGDVHVVRKRQLAIIEEVKLLNTELYPGDTAQVEVTLRPHRAEPFTQILEVPIPENIQTGDASLTVSGGYYGAYQSVDLSLDVAGESMPQDHVVGGHVKGLEDLFKEYAEGPKNNELVVEILPYFIDVMETEPMPLEGEGSGMMATEPTETKVAEEMPVAEEPLHATEAEVDETKEQSVKELFQTDYVLEGSLTLEMTILEKVEETPSEANLTEEQTEPTQPPTEESTHKSGTPARRGKNI